MVANNRTPVTATTENLAMGGFYNGSYPSFTMSASAKGLPRNKVHKFTSSETFGKIASW
ncbi:MAG: hypothetical protein QMC35_01560 [Polaribacter sp.]